MDRRIPAVGTALTLLVLVAIQARASEPDIRSLPFQMTAVDITQTAFAEPSIAITPRGTVLMCGPLGFPGGRNGFIRTEDWTTFERFEVSDRTGGGDCELKVGPDGAVYTANLQLWASAVRKSVDDGKTWTYQTTEDAVEQDRQWLATDPTDGSIVYMGYHDWSIGAIVIAKSLDGAKTFPIHSVVSTDPVYVARSGGGTIPGPVRVDPTDHDRVYMVWSVSNVADCAETGEDPSACAFRPHRTILVGRSDDGGLTWANHLAMEAPVGSRLGNLIPWLSLDNAGNLYVAAAGWTVDPASGARTNGLFMAASSDGAQTWSGPIKVNTGDGAVVFPTVVGGADGIADFAWLEADVADADDPDGVWRLGFAQARDATAAAPSFTEVIGPVVHEGDVCTRGLLCVTGGDRSLLDFIDMTLDEFGYAHIAATSTEPFHHIVWWRQDAGPSALSEPCPTAGEPGCITERPMRIGQYRPL